MKELKPYYKRGDKLFFRKGKLITTVTRTSKGIYKFGGDVIPSVSLRIFHKEEGEDMLNLPIVIKVYD
jgi:hypothetical protein